MSTMNSQLFYDFLGDSKPAEIPNGDEPLQIVKYDQFSDSMQNINAAMSQKTIQDNAANTATLNDVNAQAFATFDPTTITLPQLAAIVLQMQGLWTRLPQPVINR